MAGLTKFLGFAFSGFLIVVAFISITIKVSTFHYFCKKNEESFFSLIVVYYFTTFYLLHDMTQIREGIACGIFLFSLNPLQKGNIRQYVLLFLVAFFFHYSSILMLLLIPLKKNRLGPLFLMLPIFGFLFHGKSLSIFENESIMSVLSTVLPPVADKISKYVDLLSKGEHDNINVFNIVYLMEMVLFYFYYFSRNKDMQNWEILFFKIFSLSLFSFYFFSDVPVFAFRLAEFFGQVDLILIPFLFSKIRPKEIGHLLFLLYCGALLYNNIVKQGLFRH